MFACMLSIDEDAVICDLAETYGIFNYRQFPVSLISTLACGLREESRIKRKISGTEKAGVDRILLAMVVDGVNTLAWMQTKDGEKGRNRPGSIVKEILEEDNKKDVQIFADAEAFERERQRIIEGMR